MAIFNEYVGTMKLKDMLVWDLAKIKKPWRENLGKFLHQLNY